MMDCLLWEDPYAGPVEESEEKEVTDTMCGRLTTTPFPIHPQCWGGGGREFRRKVKPSKKESMRGGREEEGVSSFSCSSHYSTMI